MKLVTQQKEKKLHWRAEAHALTSVEGADDGAGLGDAISGVKAELGGRRVFFTLRILLGVALRTQDGACVDKRNNDCVNCGRATLRASLSSSFGQTLPELVNCWRAQDCACMDKESNDCINRLNRATLGESLSGTFSVAPKAQDGACVDKGNNVSLNCHIRATLQASLSGTFHQTLRELVKWL